MVLLPFYILSAAIDIGVCLAAGFSGWMLVLMLAVLYIASFLALIILYVLAAAVISLFLGMEEREKVNRFCYAVVNYTVGGICALFRVRIHTEGFEKLPEGRWLYVSNHRSGFDALSACWALRKYGVSFIMKPAIMNIPIAGPFLRRSCFFAIDRENDREALKTIIKATKLIKDDEASIAVYPEGTRNPEGKGLLPFRNGVFKIAQRAGVPVVVATVKNSENVLRNFPRKATDVYLKVCRVISAEEVAEMKTNDIGDEVRKCMIQDDC